MQVSTERADTAAEGGPFPGKAGDSEARLTPQAPTGLVVIGASAGGLEATGALLDHMPTDLGTAFVVIQHLDPTHTNLLVPLLARHTTMPVVEAADGQTPIKDQVYVIAPGSSLTVRNGTLIVGKADPPRGLRVPIDEFLTALAEEAGQGSACIILSGTGADGSKGIAALQRRGGVILAQEPAEATASGMPDAAIATGLVDAVLPVAQIGAALKRLLARPLSRLPSATADSTDAYEAIIALMRSQLGQDFQHYKRGTIHRRIERRMQMAGYSSAHPARFKAFLEENPAELAALVQDMRIHVTRFFRDPAVFDMLERTIIPAILAGKAAGQSIRVWVAGCSTGEGTYSLAMLFHEAIAASGRALKLQIFSSDAEPDVIATAREGIFAKPDPGVVSDTRLAQFFVAENGRYRVQAALRESIVFTVQDLLSDPPFSRIDLLSCRNTMIYLDADAQAKAVSVFHFALQPGGILLLGGAEAIVNSRDRFVEVAKSERIYRHIGRARPLDMTLPTNGVRPSPAGATAANQRPAPTPHQDYAGIMERALIDAFAPAAVLIDQHNDCVYFHGPTHRYLDIAAGPPTLDLLALLDTARRGPLLAALRRVRTGDGPISLEGRPRQAQEGRAPFLIHVQAIANDMNGLVLVSFADHAASADATFWAPQRPSAAEGGDPFDTLHAELDQAHRDLDLAMADQRVTREEALSASEEYQSANEELVASKEELQSLNEELSALNSQLQETLERQRMSSNDLRNVLYSTDVAAIFLDFDLRIRFFTPATTKIFNVIASDLGRPLADLQAIGSSRDLAQDAREVIETLTPSEREIETQSDVWFLRRILPYRGSEDKVEGVVVTFADISERRATALALEAAKQKAETATIAKSRFLAAASHDLRQPLQTMSLLQGLLAKSVGQGRASALVERLDATLGAMTSILNSLLDINQIEAGTVKAERVGFPLNDLFDTLRDEFVYQAQANRVSLRVVPTTRLIHTDPRLLEQMIRNLLSNALKYTLNGRVLMGCRWRGGMLSIEIWDTGIGIADSEQVAIFREYHQIGNAERQRAKGLGLGLAIVQRLGRLLGHKVEVRSQLGRGSIFSIEVPALPKNTIRVPRPAPEKKPDVLPARSAAILVIEDDPDVRELLVAFLSDEGHEVLGAADGVAALDLVATRQIIPELVFADFNLPNGMNGLEVVEALRSTFHNDAPVVMLTGDITSDTLRRISRAGCTQINKPVRLTDLQGAIGRLLAGREPRKEGRLQVVPEEPVAAKATIHVIDDDANLRAVLRTIFEGDGFRVETYETAETFIEVWRPAGEACLLVDAYLPGLSGLELLGWVRSAGYQVPAIMLTGHSDVPIAVKAMKAGAVDFIEKPASAEDLLNCVTGALELARDSGQGSGQRADAARQVAGLTGRQRQILDAVLAGHPSKNIAADLHISQRTVEKHRAAIMSKMGAKSLPSLARRAIMAGI